MGIRETLIAINVNKFDMVALDSLGALYSLVELENPRREMFHFIGGIKNLGATFFLLTEVSRSSEDLAPHNEDFIADGIIHLKRHTVSEGDSQLRIDIVKMRKNKHKHGVDQFLMSSHGANGKRISYQIVASPKQIPSSKLNVFSIAISSINSTIALSFEQH